MPHKHLILIIEDEPSLRYTIATVLQRSGFRVAAAADVDQADRAIKKEVPCLVFLDILLPGENGLDWLARLRRGVHDKQIPVLVLTQLHDDVYRKRAEGYGINGYFVKAQHSLHEILQITTQLLHTCAVSEMKLRKQLKKVGKKAKRKG